MFERGLRVHEVQRFVFDRARGAPRRTVLDHRILLIRALDGFADARESRGIERGAHAIRREDVSGEAVVHERRPDARVLGRIGNVRLRAEQLDETVEDREIARRVGMRHHVEREVALDAGQHGGNADADGIAGAEFGHRARVRVETIRRPRTSGAAAIPNSNNAPRSCRECRSNDA